MTLTVFGNRFPVGELVITRGAWDELPQDEYIGDMIRDKLIYYPTVTREPFSRMPPLVSCK